MRLIPTWLLAFVIIALLAFGFLRIVTSRYGFQAFDGLVLCFMACALSAMVAARIKP